MQRFRAEGCRDFATIGAEISRRGDGCRDSAPKGAENFEIHVFLVTSEHIFLAVLIKSYYFKTIFKNNIIFITKNIFQTIKILKKF